MSNQNIDKKTTKQKSSHWFFS